MNRIQKFQLLGQNSEPPPGDSSNQQLPSYRDYADVPVESQAQRDFSQVTKPNCFFWVLVFSLITFVAAVVISMFIYDHIKQWLQ